MSTRTGGLHGCPQVIMATLVALLMASGCARVAESERIATGTVPADAGTDRAGEPLPETDSGQAERVDRGAVEAPTPLREPRYEIFQGTGSVVGEPRTTQALATVEPGGDITLDFVDADVREVLQATLGRILGVNYVVGPQVQGTITVQSGRPVPRDALLPTLETVLRLHGLALIREGATYRVEPLPGAARGNASIRLGMSGATPGDAYSVQIVPLNYVDAAQMAETLRPMARETSILHVDRTRNLLILGGTRFELAALLQAIEIFDVNWLSGMSFALFSLEAAQAKTLVDELSSILGNERGELMGGMVRVVPVERLNAILAISRQPRYLEEMRAWVERLDRVGGSTVERQLHIYFVQNGKASGLADVLNDVFGAEEQPAARAAVPESGMLAPGLEPAEIRTTSTDPTEITRQLQEQEEALAQAEPTPEQEPQVPEPPAPRTSPLESRAATGESIALSERSRVRVVADEERNALLISGTEAEYRSVLRVLRELDRRPLEVLIEATIADVTLSDRLEYGVRWFFEEGNHSVTLTDLASGAVAPTPPGLSYVFAATNARAVLDLLATVTDVQVISAPQLLVLNNQEAQLQVGDQVPIATQQATSTTDPDAPIVSTVQLRDTGVILKVTPRVNEGGLVILEIEQEVSQVNQDADTGTITPTISKRVITTTVAVQSGRTVALGGLIRDSKTNTRVGLPVLSSIPFLGTLFRYTTDVTDRSELLVLVSPRVISDDREALAVTEELRRRMEDLEQLESRIE